MAAPELVTTAEQIYKVVADRFASKIEEHFATEESLMRLWMKQFPGIQFDRTDRWNTVLLRELDSFWKQFGPVVKSSMTQQDRLNLINLVVEQLDYNIASQVLLNLQNWSMIQYRVMNAERDLAALETKWAGRAPSPLTKSSVMFKDASNRDQEDFNRDLSTVRSLRIIAKASPHPSFRVSPKGSTPALTDSSNLSSLGIGADQYLVLPPGVEAYYLGWDEHPGELELRQDGKLYSPGIKYGFLSKSGGQVLRDVLAARRLTVAAWQAIRPECKKVVLPRMASLLILTDEAPERLREFSRAVQAGEVTGAAWPVKLFEGGR